MATSEYFEALAQEREKDMANKKEREETIKALAQEFDKRRLELKEYADFSLKDLFNQSKDALFLFNGFTEQTKNRNRNIDEINPSFGRNDIFYLGIIAFYKSFILLQDSVNKHIKHLGIDEGSFQKYEEINKEIKDYNDIYILYKKPPEGYKIESYLISFSSDEDNFKTKTTVKVRYIYYNDILNHFESSMRYGIDFFAKVQAALLEKQ